MQCTSNDRVSQMEKEREEAAQALSRAEQAYMKAVGEINALERQVSAGYLQRRASVSLLRGVLLHCSAKARH